MVFCLSGQKDSKFSQQQQKIHYPFFLQLLAPYFAIFLTFDIANCINKELGKLINFLICLREERGCNFPFAFPFQIPQPFSLMLCSLCSLRIAEICVWKTAQSDKERL